MIDMSKVEEIEAAIESLSDEEYVRLRKWWAWISTHDEYERMIKEMG